MSKGKKIAIWLIMILVLAAGIGGCAYKRYQKKLELEDRLVKLRYEFLVKYFGMDRNEKGIDEYHGPEDINEKNLYVCLYVYEKERGQDGKELLTR